MLPHPASRDEIIGNGDSCSHPAAVVAGTVSEARSCEKHGLAVQLEQRGKIPSDCRSVGMVGAERLLADR